MIKKMPRGLINKFDIWITIRWVLTQPINGKVGTNVGPIVKENGIGLIGIKIMIGETIEGSMIYMFLSMIEQKVKSPIPLILKNLKSRMC